ncbi:MAG: Toluene efflux pump periplasmic linker protein TtgA precursor [Smithella sp. PtaU1.Bin162]|nr:MAG: Toluene efflux pump periplasmic linker protein TtgA precursor [Smithella sp. PtaU1.Bin162]
MDKKKIISLTDISFFVVLTFCALFISCNGQPAGVDAKPVLVEVTEVVTKDVPVWSEWTASTDGLVNATIRSQVQGYLLIQHYKEGEYVKKGQLLFEIDDRTFQAALKQATSRVTQARADWENAKANLVRIKPLAEYKAVSAKDLDEAIRAEGVGKASYEAAVATADKAELDLKFTKIISPIDGIAGAAKAQVGNLVGPGSTEELTSVSTVDPIKVSVPLTEQEYLRDMRGGKNGKAKLELVLADGSVHHYKGKFTFVDRQVDVDTGTIKVNALFPNPGNFLRPGMFARVRAEIKIRKGAALVPQRAVIEVQGNREVAVVNAGNKIDMTPVKTGPRFGEMWVVEEGLQAGQKVVVEGTQKVRQGVSVTPRPFQANSPGQAQKGK